MASFTAFFVISLKQHALDVRIGPGGFLPGYARRNWLALAVRVGRQQDRAAFLAAADVRRITFFLPSMTHDSAGSRARRRYPWWPGQILT